MIILIKCKPQYEISINDKVIGYLDAIKELDTYIESATNVKENKNIAFVNINDNIKINLKLVDRNLNKEEDKTKKEIENNLIIEYTSYAVTLNGTNTVYLSTQDEAKKMIEELNEEKEYEVELGTIQVYSEKFEDIKPIEYEVAKNNLNKAIQVTKKSTIKVARNTKSSSINGVRFEVKPVNGTITSRFGKRSSPGGIGSTNHKGLDIAAKLGTPIYASASGTVKYAGYKGSLGNLIIIDSGNDVEIYYGHCNKLFVSQGKKVSAGEKIGTVGKTGTATGYHLHFEIHLNGKVVNPQRYVY